jgi:hypothetical protein
MLVCSIAVSGGDNDINMQVLNAERQPILEEPRLAGTNVVQAPGAGEQEHWVVLDNSFSSRTHKSVEVRGIAALTSEPVLALPPIVTSTVAPTPMPVPTPTPTPVPTPTPAPAPTPTAGLSSDELAYVTTIHRQATTMHGSMSRFRLLAGQVPTNPSILLDPNWRVKAAAELAIWKATYEQAKGLTPPPRFAAMHDTYLRALEQFSLAADDIAYGIDHLDADRINAGTSKLEEGARLLEEAAQQMPQP